MKLILVIIIWTSDFLGIGYSLHCWDAAQKEWVYS